MDFTNKGSLLSIVFYIVIVLLGIYFFIQILPFILLAVVIAWLCVKGVRTIKGWKNKRSGGNIVNNVDIIKDDLDDFSNKKVIDVKYTELNKKK